ncbi:Flp family type IVb pilin [Zobellella iuensis]|uniref:Pilus assembly protein n=1 Tax=Zobellella iuensis TaxID=2803811 RepID=A0ABS1QW39_9GAMM|nr:pilus assembly protein [Zobellella iuensis]MBL1378449.1 pilus assembly protein [Zobellella iuensis]
MLILKELNRLIEDEEGLTTVEYAIAGTLVAVAVVTAFSNLGDAVGDRVQDMANIINGEVTAVDPIVEPE